MSGKGSNPGLVLAALALLCVVANPASAACTLQKYASIDVEIIDNGAVLMPVKANGQDAWMILGMASGLSTAWRDAAEHLGLPMRSSGVPNMQSGDGKSMQTALLDSLVIGNVNFGKAELVLNQGGGSGGEFRGKPMLGMLGSKIVTAVDMELDLGHGKVNFFKHSGCNGGQVYWASEAAKMKIYFDQGGLMLFPLEVDGKSVEAALYTEGNVSVINEEVTKRYFGFGRDSPATREAGAGGDTAGYRTMSLTAKGGLLAVKNAKFELQDILPGDCQPVESDRNTHAIGYIGCFNVAPLSVGTDILKKLRIFIASVEGNIYFTPAAAADPAAAAKE